MERAAWWAETMRRDPTRLVFVDESGTNLSLTPRYGRAPRGQRVVGVVPRNHGPNVTLIAAMDQDGLCGELTITGALDQLAFEAYVTRILVPHLWPGDLVILDNLSAHKSKRARMWLEATGAEVVFLPPYSPDFNPIENAFAKLKALLRKAAERTVEGLWQTIGTLLEAFSPTECANYFAAAGYEPN